MKKSICIFNASLHRKQRLMNIMIITNIVEEIPASNSRNGSGNCDIVLKTMKELRGRTHDNLTKKKMIPSSDRKAMEVNKQNLHRHCG